MRKSLSDSDINELLVGKSVTLGFTPYARISTALQTVHEGVRNISVGLEDGHYQFNGKDVTVSDMEVASIALYLPEVIQYGNLDHSTGYYDPIKKTDPTTFFVRGYKNGGWLDYSTCTLSYESGKYKLSVIPETANGAIVSGYSVMFPSNVEKVKLETVTSDAIITICYDIKLRVKPSQAILNEINNSFNEDGFGMIEISNKAEAYARKGSTSYYSSFASDKSYIHGKRYKMAADLDKEFSMVRNDEEEVVELNSTILLNQQTNETSLSLYNYAKGKGYFNSSNSGVFYDLLPRGMVPNLNSVSGINASIQDVSAIQNYKGSKQTLVIIRAKLNSETSLVSSESIEANPRYFGDYPSGGGYREQAGVSFNCFYTWDNAFRYGVSGIKNTAAYEADEPQFGNITGWSGEPDDPTAGNNVTSMNAVGDKAPLMTDLDSTRDSNSFVYASATLTGDPINIMAVTSLQKFVADDLEGEWTDGRKTPVNIQEGGRYSYMLRAQSASDTETKNIVLFDSLEQYTPQIVDDDYGDEQWKGYFRSIDTSDLEELGIDPVVYYSTIPNLDLSNYVSNHQVGHASILLETDSRNGEAVWSKTPPSDLSTVTAIAVDASTKKDGTPFILSPNNFIHVEIGMRAPSGVNAEPYFHGDGIDPDLNCTYPIIQQLGTPNSKLRNPWRVEQ